MDNHIDIDWAEVKAQIANSSQPNSPLSLIENAFLDEKAPFELVDQKLDSMIAELTHAFHQLTSGQP